VSGLHTPFTYRADRTIADAAGLPLARCYANRGEESIGPLFAVAPELLEACKALDAMWLEDWEPPHSDPEQQEPRLLAKECLDIWRAIRAAIAKARGEAA